MTLERRTAMPRLAAQEPPLARRRSYRRTCSRPRPSHHSSGKPPRMSRRTPDRNGHRRGYLLGTGDTSCRSLRAPWLGKVGTVARESCLGSGMIKDTAASCHEAKVSSLYALVDGCAGEKSPLWMA